MLDHGQGRRALVILSMALAALLASCATPASRHPVIASDLGAAARSSQLEASLSQPGVATLERVRFARWTAGRGAFIDWRRFDNAALAAGFDGFRDDPRATVVPKGDEEAVIYAYVVNHPRFGQVMIDSGVSAELGGRLNGLMRRAVSDLDIHVERTTAQWLSGQAPPRAVFLTHLHFDHVGGLIDLPVTTPVYVGAGEAQARSRVNLVLGSPADAALHGYGPLREWSFQPDADGRFAGVLDIFGDGSIWAISTPGHSAGSTAYLINTVNGPKLVVGDAVSTRLGWEQQMPQPVAPSARADAEASAERLRGFAAAHPNVEVFLGHQSRTGQDEPR